MTEQQGTEREDEAMDVAEYMKVKLSKPYKLDGKEVSEIDMGALEELTGADMLAIDRTMKRRGNTDASPEFTLEFAFFAAMQATGLPLEFFHGLSMKDSIKVKMEMASGSDMRMAAGRDAGLSAGKDIRLEDGRFATTLSSVMERLEALDGDRSARKQEGKW